MQHQHPDVAQTQQDTPSASSAHVGHQERLSQTTLSRYESLSYFEREEVKKWLKQNLANIPMPSKIKKPGLERLLSGEEEAPAVLVLIRYALKALNL